MLKRIMALALAMVVGILSYRTGFAEESEFTYIAMLSGCFEIENGTAACCGLGRSQSAKTSTILQVALQRREANSILWKPVYTWSNDGEGVQTVSASGEMKISTGYDYRICISCIIKDSEGIIQETDNICSNVISY